MAKSVATPASPTVLCVFSEFLKKLEADKSCSETALASLRNAIEQQALDPQTLRDALFKDPPAEKT